MSYREEQELMLKVVAWMNNAYAELYRAGGNPAVMIERIPDEMLLTFIRNSIHLKYDRSIYEATTSK